MALLTSRRAQNAAGFLACAAMIGYALYAQYVEGLNPCPLCWFQRVEIFALGVVFLLAAVHNPRKVGSRIYAMLLAVAALTAVSTAARHLWIQSLPPGSVPSCGASVDYLFEIMPVFDVIKKVLSGSGECQHVDTLLGLSWPWWTLISTTVLGIWGVAINWKPSRR